MTAGIQPNVPRPPRSPLGGNQANVSWRERFEALKNIPPLLKMVWETHRGYAAAIVVLRLVRAMVPLAVLWVGKLIIDSIQSLDRPVMVAYLMLVALLFILINLTVDVVYALLDPRLRTAHR